MQIDDVAGFDDTDVLWKALLAAKGDGHHELATAIENRMRQLSELRRFAHLTDDELMRQIRALQAGRRAGGEDLIRYAGTSGSGGGGNDDARQIIELNKNILANQASGINEKLSLLIDEANRRGLLDEQPE